jgi:hypothetical protein
MPVPSFTVERRHRGQRTDAQRAADRAFGVSPVPAVTPAARTIRTPLSGGELATLERLAERVDRNEPSRAHPEQFHIEKSELRSAMRRVIGALRTGQAIPQIEDRERGKQR